MSPEVVSMLPPSPVAKSSPKLAWGWALGAIVVGGAVVAASNLTHDRLFHGPGQDAGKAGDGPSPPVAEKPAHDPTTTVVLPEGKFQQADIRVEPARAVEMPKEVAATGRIEADPNRRVEVRPRASGVVRTVPVLPGHPGQEGGRVLVVLDSPDVGSARLLVRERQRALATVRVEAAWKAEIAANVRGHDRAAPQGGPRPRS